MNGGFICIFKREALTSFLRLPYVEYFVSKNYGLNNQTPLPLDTEQMQTEVET